MINMLLVTAPHLNRWATDPEASHTSLWVVLTVVLVLILLNALYVAAEFALLGVRPTQLEEMADEGNVTAAKMLAIVSSPTEQDQYIATAQMGITLASLGLGMYGEPKLAIFLEPIIETVFRMEPSSALLHTISFVVTLSLLTYLHIVIGEMIPKSIALATADRAALFLYRPMTISEAVFKWPVRLLNKLGILLLRLFQIPPATGHARLYSPEEIELIVSESLEGGFINEDESEMIHNIFDFSERQVGQVMRPRTRVQAIPEDMSYEEIMQLVVKSNHSRFPVYKEDLDHITGILHLKDLVRHRLENPDGEPNFNIQSITRPPYAVSENMPVEELLASFKKERMHMSIVRDEFGGMAGIVTLEDLVEEVVGEVHDEFDHEKAPRIDIAPGLMEVSGDYLLDNLQDGLYLGHEDNLPDVETIGGLIITLLGRPPQVSDVVAYEHYATFTVLEVSGLAVSRAKIEYQVPHDPAQLESDVEL